MLRRSYILSCNPLLRLSYYSTDVAKKSTLSDLKYMYLSPVWPQPNGSAAGVRNYEILTILRNLTNNSSKYKLIKSNAVKQIKEKATQQNADDTETEIISQQIVYVTPQPIDSVHVRELQDAFKKRVDAVQIDPNSDGQLFSRLLQEYQPDVAIFDTFAAEEFYSWHIFRHAPECIRIVDTQDLRFMRKHREELLSRSESGGDHFNQSELIQSRPTILGSELLAREMASLHRSDFNFVVSPFEKDLLVNDLRFPEDKLALAPFYYENTKGLKPSWFPSFKERNDFVFIGSFKHTPNVDAVEVFNFS
jgi:hypothetical protein